MNQLSEIFKALRTALLADGTLTALLGAADAIYFEDPRADLPFPCITIDVRELNPQNRNGSFTGIWRTDLQFNLFGVDPHVLTDMNAHLEAAWDIPRNRQLVIDSDNYRLTLLQHIGGGHVGTIRLLSTQRDLRHYASEWRCKVSKKTGT